MLQHYLTMAARSFVRHKLYSFINVIGLSVGLACVIFAILFVRDELSYDKWIPNTSNLYRLELTIRLPGRPSLPLAVIPFPMPAAMRDEIPGVTGMTRLNPETMTLASGDRQFLENNVDVVDPGFFEIIRLPLLMGNADTVFRQPESAVLSESTARRFFGNADPIGRILTAARGNCSDSDLACRSETVSLRVTGIVRDLPHNTQLAGDVFIPNTSLADQTSQQMKRDWYSAGGWGYITLAPGVAPATVLVSLGPIFDRDLTPDLRKAGDTKEGRQVYQAHLTPFARVHLDSSRWQDNQTPSASRDTLYSVVAIGVLILLIACFNFMNLATARALLRVREIALRKTLGARRQQLILQFLGEAVLMALLALVLAFAIAEMLMPLFDGFLHRPLAIHYASDWGFLLALVGIAVATGLISGSYPALVLSGLRPAGALRANSSGPEGSGTLRNVLVLLQFSASIGLGIAAIVVFSQVDYERNLPLGFNHSDIVVITGGGLTTREQKTLVDALRANPGITAAGLSDSVPFDTSQRTVTVGVPGRSELMTLYMVIISPDYPQVYGIPVIAGRLLSAFRGDDQLDGIRNGGDPLNEGRNILLNAAAARRLGFAPPGAVGKGILFDHNLLHIVGVLADAKTLGAHQAARPTIYVYVPGYPMQLSVRLRTDMVPQTLAFVDQTWRAFAPGVPIQRRFLNQSFESLYRADERQGALFGVFVGIAVLIACLGLYGLAVFTAERKTKEIGIRKVSGARNRDLVWLMLWRISIPVMIANAIAWPVAYYYLSHWLGGYAYRIPLSPVYFLAAGAAALLIAWATVYGNTLRLAHASPIHALRYE